MKITWHKGPGDSGREVGVIVQVAMLLRVEVGLLLREGSESRERRNFCEKEHDFAELE